MPTALIIGAGSRIGHATATAFAGAGYKVAVASRTAKLQDVSAFTHFVFDAAKPETVRELFESVRKMVGIPSVVIYNGIFFSPFSPF
jgi:NAD(P)-dependent dehydrogenase (short-subunit alcohol dehydrogenase family)